MQSTPTRPNPLTTILANAIPRLAAITAVCMIFGAKALENERQLAAATPEKIQQTASHIAMNPARGEEAPTLN